MKRHFAAACIALSITPALAETPAEQQANAIAGIEKAGWTVTIDDTKPGKPVVAVFANIPDDKHPPIDYKHLKQLPQLQEISFMFSCVKDADLVNIRNLKELRKLDFVFEGITDAGLVHFKGLKELRELNLAEGPDITDAGLEHLKGLTKLERFVVGTGGIPQITDDGLAHLKNLKVLSIAASKVTDDGLQHLKGLQNLRVLQLESEFITKAAVEELKRDLPNCKVDISGGKSVSSDGE